jgi:hypothetical protein
MLVLHGFWSMSGSLRLWAEDSDLLVKSPSQALRSARPHPFAAAAEAIASPPKIHANRDTLTGCIRVATAAPPSGY